MACDTSKYDFKVIPPLTEEEKLDPFAEFYDVTIQRPPEKLMAVVGEKQMDPADAIPFEEIERLCEPDFECATGWCMLPDGTGYSNMFIELPGITAEMEDWWGKWMMDPVHNSLHYRIWLPSLHISHVGGITEDLGWGPIHISMGPPVKPPLSRDPKEIDPTIRMFLFSTGAPTPIDVENAEPYHLPIVNIVRVGPKGASIRYLAFHGMDMVDGKLVKVHDADPDKVRLLAMHNAYEFTRKGLIEPLMFAKAMKAD